jgi:hypothetical protein
MPNAVRNAAAQSARSRPPAEDRPGLAQAAATVLLAAAAFVAPLAMGCTHEWARLGLETAMTCAVVLWAVAGRDRAWAFGLPAAIAALVLLQLVPLPDKVLVNLAPVSAGAWKAANEGNAAAWGTISINPAATAAGGRRLLLGLATVAAVAGLSRSPRHRLWLTAGLALSALVILTVGFLFPFDREDRTLLGFIDLKGPIEFWRTPVLPPAQTSGWAYLDWVTLGDRRYVTDLRVIGDGFGPSITSNQFAGSVYLTLPAALGLLFWATRDRGRWPAIAGQAAAVLLLGAAIWIVGHMAASRAGVAALLMAGLTLAAFAAPPGWLRRITSIAAMGYAAFIFVFALLFLANFQTLSDLLPEQWRARALAAGDDGRGIASRAAMRMFRASPLLGTGLGTYGDLYPQLLGSKYVWYFAHNDYAQLLAETGLVGLFVASAFVVLLAVHFRRFVQLPDSATKLLGAASWASLAALLAHSLFDWNLHVPANAFLAALTAGLCLGSVPASPQRNAAPATRSGPLAAFGPKALLVAACLAVLTLLARDARSDAAERSLRLATALSTAKPADRKRQAALSLDAAVSKAERAAKADPSNAGLALALGQAHLHAAAPGTDSEPRAAAADFWFRRAQASRAVSRGLPQPVPPQPPSTPGFR